jgi:hypothetical protein
LFQHFHHAPLKRYLVADGVGAAAGRGEIEQRAPQFRANLPRGGEDVLVRGFGEEPALRDAFVTFAGGLDGQVDGQSGKPRRDPAGCVEVVAGRGADGGIGSARRRLGAAACHVPLRAGDIKGGMKMKRYPRQRLEVPGLRWPFGHVMPKAVCEELPEFRTGQ